MLDVDKIISMWTSAGMTGAGDCSIDSDYDIGFHVGNFNWYSTSAAYGDDNRAVQACWQGSLLALAPTHIFALAGEIERLRKLLEEKE